MCATTGLEPFLIKAAVAAISPIFKATLEAGNARLKKVNEEHANDAQRAIAYLETANELMVALEGETDQILLNAMTLATSSDEATRTALLTRLNNLLHGEVMRPALIEVHARLLVLQDALKENSGRFFGLKSPPKKVAETVARLTAATGYIHSYLTWLEQQTPGWYASSPFVTEMMRLRDALAAGVDGAVIAERARQAISGRYPVAMVHCAEIGKVIEEIQTRMR